MVGHLPADDHAAVDVDDERGVGEPGPGPQIRDIRDPQPVRSRRGELTVDEICWPARRLVAPRRAAGCAPHHPGDRQFTHQALDRAAGHRGALPAKRPPDLASPVHAPVGLEDPPDLDLELGVTHRPRRERPGLGRVIGGGGDRQHRADRLDPVEVLVVVDVGDHLGGRGSSSRAKKADADLRISFARRSSLTHAQARGSALRLPCSPPADHHHQPRPDGPNGAASPSWDRTSQRSNRSPPTATRTRPDGPTPSGPPAPAAPADIDVA
jgi:hypothetical protein